MIISHLKRNHIFRKRNKQDLPWKHDRTEGGSSAYKLGEGAEKSLGPLEPVR